MMRRRAALAIALAALALTVGRRVVAEGATEPPVDFRGAVSVKGTVYWDANANGIRDPGEAGAAGIRLLANHRVATTDADGRYSLADPDGIVTVSLSFPSGTWPTAGWFRRTSREREDRLDFGLKKEEQDTPFCFVQFTDPHGSHPMTMPLVYRECQALPLKPRFYICTGDMRSGDPTVRNVPDLVRTFTRIGSNFRKFPAPLFMVPGNHDTVEYGGGGNYHVTPEEAGHPLFGSRAWERYVCPSHWSFSYDGVHFIGVEYADWVGGTWNHMAPETLRWVKQELAAMPAGTRSILFAHAPRVGKVVGELGLTLGLFGDSHTEGLYFPAGSEKPSFGPNVLVGGLCQPRTRSVSRGGKRTATRAYTQDGMPTGYRIVVVEKDRIDTFYKPFGEPHAIMVNYPRRFLTLRPGKVSPVRGQAFDPERKITKVQVGLDGVLADVVPVRRRMWVDFEARLDLAAVPEGFHDLTVRVTSDGQTHGLTEPYLLLTGRADTFKPTGPAAGTVQPGKSGTEFTVTVAPELLRRLNRVTLAPGAGDSPSLANVHMTYAGQEFVDQHRIFAWMLDPKLGRPGSGPHGALYFDLKHPGPPVRWHMEMH